jgi:membrane-associated protein
MSFLDPVKIISTLGYAGIFAIIFAESGLFFGFFLPGDSLLLTAGLLASRGLLVRGQDRAIDL